MRSSFGLLAVLAFSVFSFAAGHAVAGDVPATQPISRSSSIDDILDALDARGKSLSDMTADLKMTDTDPNDQSETIHIAKLWLQKKGNDDARVMIVFSSMQTGDHPVPENRSYFLDNGKLIERDYKRKNETSRQIIKPGQPMNLLKLGEGPFPLPIGQKKEEVKAEFDVKKMDPAKDDPADSIHLQLAPKPKSPFAKNFKTIDIWIDPASQMPVRIQTLDRTGATMKTTELSDLKINPGLTDKDFTEPELPAGWNTRDEPFER